MSITSIYNKTFNVLFMYGSNFNAYKICVVKCSHEPMTTYNNALNIVIMHIQTTLQLPCTKVYISFIRCHPPHLDVNHDWVERYPSLNSGWPTQKLYCAIADINLDLMHKYALTTLHYMAGCLAKARY